MPGGAGTNFNGDPPPRVRRIPWNNVVKAFLQKNPERNINMYPFSTRRIFPDPSTPGIYDPSTDDLSA